MRGAIVQLSVSAGGLPKTPVETACLTELGLQGDAVAHPLIHGGPRKAVLLVTLEGIEELKARGYPLFPGALGENFTVRGLDRRAMRLGQRFRAGSALLELTRLRGPCSSLDVYGPRLKLDLQTKGLEPGAPAWGLGGFYAAVLEPGSVRVNDIIWLVDALG